MQLLLGFILGIFIAITAWKVGVLSNSGGWAAALTGGLIFGLGGLSWAVLLLAFFISSSALSKAFSRRKTALNEKFSKGSRRDWEQVLANGGLGALLVIIYALFPTQDWLWPAFSGAMAAVNADTWATELGVLSRSLPRLITNGKVVERGTSGGISGLGSLAALAGALLIAFLAVILTPLENSLSFLLAAGLGGLAGSLFDSLLGATIQAIYYCQACSKETERHPYHSCGNATTLIRGKTWMNNDWVNFACSVVGALTTLALLGMLSH